MYPCPWCACYAGSEFNRYKADNGRWVCQLRCGKCEHEWWDE